VDFLFTFYSDARDDRLQWLRGMAAGSKRKAVTYYVAVALHSRRLACILDFIKMIIENKSPPTQSFSFVATQPNFSYANFFVQIKTMDCPRERSQQSSLDMS